MKVKYTNLTRAQREDMVERFLRGEPGASVARAFGVDRTLPALRAYTWGYVNGRVTRVRPQDLTPAGRQWLAERAHYAVHGKRIDPSPPLALETR